MVDAFDGDLDSSIDAFDGDVDVAPIVVVDLEGSRSGDVLDRQGARSTMGSYLNVAVERVKVAGSRQGQPQRQLVQADQMLNRSDPLRRGTSDRDVLKFIKVRSPDDAVLRRGGSFPVQGRAIVRP